MPPLDTSQPSIGPPLPLTLKTGPYVQQTTIALPSRGLTSARNSFRHGDNVVDDNSKDFNDNDTINHINKQSPPPSSLSAGRSTRAASTSAAISVGGSTLGASLKNRITNTWSRSSSTATLAGQVKAKPSRSHRGLMLLRSSPEPLVDLIFVHGLRGSAIDTWRRNGDPSLFWPQAWLPGEPRLHNVNIHTFGYDSDWTSTKASILNLHDFGQSLLEAMRNSPHMATDPKSPVILLGHSMGGLVAKKAYILSQMVPTFKNRIRAIFFLATPHRGSDHAVTLNKILAISGLMSSRGYITDLSKGSSSNQSINEDFGKLANELLLFSFYETEPMNIGISTCLVVERHEAVLGFSNERVQFLEGNHREICKFHDPEDSNYDRVKNAIVSATEDLLISVHRVNSQGAKEQLKVLKTYLGIPDRIEEQHSVMPGSCQWIEERADFQTWRDTSTPTLIDPRFAEHGDECPSMFWVNANPGAGKTFLAAHVGSLLIQSRSNCASYFFHYGKKTSLSLSDSLRSIAYQLAATSPIIREALVVLADQGVSIDIDDARMIWTVIYKQCIFQLPLQSPQYWVLDAIDECKQFSDFFTMIRGLKMHYPLRIFITSRKIPEMQRLKHLLDPTATVTLIEIPLEGSTHDIKRYIRSRMDQLMGVSETEREEFEQIIVSKSNSCFLWVRMVFDELEKVYSYESRRSIIQNIPEDMISYYERTIQIMADNKHEKHLAKAILRWVAGSSRDMTTQELTSAIKLDTKVELLANKATVEGLCGQLVSVCESSGVVSVVHSTAREFLFSDAAGEFMVSKELANEKIALACLQLLTTSPDMRPSYGRKNLRRGRNQSQAPGLLDYALSQVFEHIYVASSRADELLRALDRFLRANILTWIYKTARRGDLHSLTRASKNLKGYLLRRAKYHSPLEREVANVSQWSIDMSRLVTRFGGALLHNPESIYLFIPALCPSNTAIYQQFGRRPDSLTVLGSRDKTWDDCTAFVSFDEDCIAAAGCCGESIVAVAMESGAIHLYNSHSCQKQGILKPKHPVDLVYCAAKRVFASTTKFIVAMDLDGTVVWQTRIRYRCILLTSVANTIIAVSQHGHVLKLDMSDGEIISDLGFAYRNHQADDDDTRRGTKAPVIAAISTDAEILALAYTMGTVCLWELDTGALIGWARDERNRMVSVVLINPNPSIALLLVVYTDHGLALFDTSSASLVHTAEVEGSGGPLSATSSVDGRTLATVDKVGDLRIWDFDSLTPLHHIRSPAYGFRILNFTQSNSSIVDITESEMRFWSPSSLVRKNIEDDMSTSDAAVPTVIEGQFDHLGETEITTKCTHPCLSVVLAGKHNGNVTAYNSATGKQLDILYEHSHGASINNLSAGKTNIIASSDVDGVVQVWRLGDSLSTLMKDRALLKLDRFSSRITQLLFSSTGKYLLVSTGTSDTVYSLPDMRVVGSQEFVPDSRKSGRWIGAHYELNDRFSFIHDHVLETFSALQFPVKIKEARLLLDYRVEDGNEEVGIDFAAIQKNSATLVLAVRQRAGVVESTTTFLFDMPSQHEDDRELPGSPEHKQDKNYSDEPTPIIAPSHVFGPQVCRYLIGIDEDKSESRLLFLHANSWVCSMTTAEVAAGQYSQHFFVPNEYIFSTTSTSSSAEVQILATSSPSGGGSVGNSNSINSNIVFSVNGNLTIVKNGLKFPDIRSVTSGC